MVPGWDGIFRAASLAPPGEDVGAGWGVWLHPAIGVIYQEVGSGVVLVEFAQGE